MITEKPTTLYIDPNDTLRKKSQEIVDDLLDQYPRDFNEIYLKDGSRVALVNDRLWAKESMQEDSEYRYTALSQYGLTEFNTSNEGPLSYNLLIEGIAQLIEQSSGEVIKDCPILELKKPIRNRINKGLIKLEAVVKTVYITGRNISDGVIQFSREKLKKFVD